MRYTRDRTLLSLSPADLDLAEPIPFPDLPSQRLLLYDETVSDFFFEFQPEQDIALFAQHARFADMRAGRLVLGEEDLFSVALTQAGTWPTRPLAVDIAATLPPPLRFTPVPAAIEVIRQGNEWRGMITECTCGFPGCFSQYAWVVGSVCVALFTISGASLVVVEWFPFRFEILGGDG